MQRDTLNRRRGNDFDEIEASPIMGRIRSLLRGSRDLRLEPSERAKVGEAGANAVLDAADVRTESRNESLAKKHFTGEQFFSIESKTAHVKTGSLAGGPGALTGISAVMVKNVDEGKWTSVNVKADGSYDLQLDQAVGTLSVWFEKEDGEKFFGGQVRDSSRDVKQNVWSAVIDNNFSPSPLSYAFRNDD